MTGPAGLALGAADGGLRTADFDRLCDLFYERTGIRFAPTKRYFVDKRVLACMREYQIEDFSTFFTALRLGSEPGLMERLINTLTVNETYFLREDYQFDSLVKNVLPEITRSLDVRPGRPIRILCLPCSTGDEAYSVAIALSESWKDLDRFDVEIVGADIDTAALRKAEQGVFEGRAVQRLPPRVLETYFESIGPRRFQVIGDFREAITFQQANIVDSRSMTRFRHYDVVFCRNLLIYFDEFSSRLAAGNLFDCLRPGGFVFLGHAESMSRITNIFEPRQFGDGIVYQKPK